MRKAQPDRAGKAFDRSERWARIHHVLPVVFCQGAEGKALAHREFVLGMEIVGISRVDRHCQAGVANVGGGDRLRLPCFRPCVFDRGRTAMPKGWQAYDVEGEVALSKEL